MNLNQMENYPVVIIGAGPAGLAAAMQLKRQGIDPLVLERKLVGGLLLNANLVENYPGFVDGISGPDLVSLFKDQAERLGVVIENEELITASFEANHFRIVTNKRILKSQLLIAGSGTKPRKIADDLYSDDWSQALFYEVYPLIEEKDKEIVIIGAGDAAFDYALNLSFNNRVTILNRGSKIKALPLLFDRIQVNKAIRYLTDTEITDVSKTASGMLNISIKDKSLNQIIECDFLLAAIGREPEYSFADPSIIDELEKLLKDQKLFLIGDLQNGSFRQTTIAVADGIRAAMLIAQILEKG
jgi:thioredoxin reductase (NADPH)